MDNKLLGILLALSTVLILSVPVVYGFSVHNWSIESLIIPEDLENLERSLEDPGEIQIEEENFDPITGEVEIDASFESDFDFDVVLRRFSGDIYYGEEEVGDIELREEVVLEAGETTEFTLYGEVDEELLMGAIDLGDIMMDMDFDAVSPEDFDLENVAMELEVMGTEIRIEDFDGMGVAP